MVDKLRAEWFAHLERLLSLRETLAPTGLECLTRCSSLCCPHVQMREMSPDQIASPVVVLLPFEMEFLVERTGVSIDTFRHWPVEVTSGVTIEVGMMDLGKPCPFLQPDFRCGIYLEKPMDCQSFPLLPSRKPSGEFAWAYEQKCPSLATLNPEFIGQIQEMWIELQTILPPGWWQLYCAADDWTGWPLPEEGAGGG